MGSISLEDEVVTSPLSRSMDVQGHHLTIKVFKGAFPEDEWFFELAEDQNSFNVSETGYPSDHDALDAAFRSILALT